MCPRGQGRPRGLHHCPSMGYIIALPFSLILNCCPTAGIFPSKLKLAKVVPVFKKGPTDLLTNYRSISLLPSLSKVFERIICNRLLFFFTSMNTTVSIRRVARYSQWGGCFWGLGANGDLGAKPPAAGGTGVWGLRPQRLKNLHFFAKIT